MKKGFTLIELLAVIVILAIIALIATPITLGIIKDAKINAAVQSANGYIDAVNIRLAQDRFTEYELDNNTYNILETDLKAKYNGTSPSHGLVTILNNNVTSASLCIDGYPIEYKNGKAYYDKNSTICPVEYKFVEPEGTIISELCNGGTYKVGSYKIKTVEDLVCFGYLVDKGTNFENSTIMLLSDLDIKNKSTYENANALSSYDINENGTIENVYTELTTGKGFNPIGSSTYPFKGNLLGYDFKINNLYINRNTNNIGLISYMSAGSVIGLNLENVNIKGADYVGGIVGNEPSKSTITLKEISVSGNIAGKSYVGGIIGYTTTTSSSNMIKSVIVNGNITGTEFVGGIGGQVSSYTTLQGVVESGSITATTGKGGKLLGSGGNNSSTGYISDAVTITRSTVGIDGTTYSNSYIGNKHSIGMFDGVLDTWISGDNDSTGYYIDYDSLGKLDIYSTERRPMEFNLKGSGTNDDPYIINNTDEWKQAVLKNKNEYYFKINDDLDFKNKEFYVFGTSSNPFKGYLLGGAHTISNLDIKGLNSVGLIGYMSAGSVIGLNLENINITGNNYVGGIVGNEPSSSTITLKEISISGDITGNKYVGGILGYTTTTSTSNTVKSVIVNANITGTDYVGGIGGKISSYTTIQGVVESGSISAPSGKAGKLVGSGGSSTGYISDAVTITRSTTGKDGTSYSSSYIGNKHSIGMFDGVLDTWISGDNDSTGYYIDYNNSGKLDIYSTERRPMEFNLKGSGTNEDPYIINNTDEWKQAVLKNKGEYYFEITGDLDFENAEFYIFGTSSNPFKGYLIGEAHTISNLDIKGLNNVGLIGYMSAGSVIGLNLENVNIKGADYVGGLVGNEPASSTITLKEISISGNITGNKYVGGILGNTTTTSTSNTVKSVIVNANITGTDYVGGIGGKISSYTTIQGVVESGSISAPSGKAGKLVGSGGSSTGYISDAVTITRSTTGKDGTSYLNSYTNNLDYYKANFSKVLDFTDSDSNEYLFGYKNIDGVDKIRVIKKS